MSSLEVGVLASLGDLDASEWDHLVPEEDVFVRHAFLQLLESSGSVGPGTGWRPQHLFVRERGSARLLGACPLYLRTDSYGEYIFDWGWARAAEQAGVPYYPKLTAAVPFTPATGPRLLVAPGGDRVAVTEALLRGMGSLEEELGALSSHVLFSLEDEAEQLEAAGFLRRRSHQYHWHGDGYRDFDDFLDRFRAAARKEIKKERRRAQTAGLTLAVETADTLSARDLAVIDRLYRSTSDRKWGRPYLSPAFFAAMGDRLGSELRVATARAGGEIVAMALAFQRGRHLYGRHWGTRVEVRDLHFELCYYQFIEHAIREGLTLFEAGAQGEHKLRRGFVPVVTHSAHRFRIPGLHDAVARFLAQERAALESELLPELRAMVPFREDGWPPHPGVAGRRAPSQ